MNSKKEEIKAKNKKDEYKVIRIFNKDGEPFQKVMESILIDKLNNLSEK